MSLDRLLRPRSIAILGASERPSIGRTLIEALDGIGFRGQVYPVNPRYESLLGRRCYPSVAELPRDVDVLAFCVNHARVLEHVRPAADRGVGAAVIFDGGFAEADADGYARQEAIASICREASMTLCGPNCMGVISPHVPSLVYIQAVHDPSRLAGNGPPTAASPSSSSKSGAATGPAARSPATPAAWPARPACSRRCCARIARSKWPTWTS